jgi:hypothetical protein
MKRRFTWMVVGGLALASGALGGCSKKENPTPPMPPTPQASTPASPTASAPPKNDAVKTAAEPTSISMAPATAPTTRSSDVVPTHEPAAALATRPTATQPSGQVEPPDDPKVATFMGLTAPKPATWIWHPPSRQFNIAEYAVPGQDGADQARVAVITAGGSLEQNVARWKTMFRTADQKPVEPKIEKFQADGMNVTVVEFGGEYRGMGAPTFTPDQLFIAGIVEAPAGQVVVRFVGPTATVEANRQAFIEMLHELRKVEAQK